MSWQWQGRRWSIGPKHVNRDSRLAVRTIDGYVGRSRTASVHANPEVIDPAFDSVDTSELGGRRRDRDEAEES